MNMHTTFPDVRVPVCAPAFPDAAMWATEPTAVALIKAVEQLSALTNGLQAIRMNNPQLHHLVEAEGAVGHVAVRLVRQECARGLNATLAPSNGACAISSLWDVLDGLRSAAIEAQMRAEGFDIPGVTPGASEASFDRRDELDGSVPHVGATLFLATAAGRA